MVLVKMNSNISLIVWPHDSCGLLIFACYGLLALAYALAGALLSALRAAAVNIEDFLYELFAALKEKVRTKVNGMQDGVAKQQAKIILQLSSP